MDPSPSAVPLREALFDAPLSAGVTRRQEQGSMIRVVRHAGVSVVIDTNREVAISVALSARFRLTYRANGRTSFVEPRIGRFGLMAPGHPVALEVVGDCVALQTILPVETMARWWAEDHGVDAAVVSLDARQSVEDSVVARLICRTKRDGIAAEGEMMRAVATRLLDRHAGRPLRTTPRARSSGGLTAAQLRRVAAFVEHGLAGPVTVEAMAAEACLSPYHFSREFRRTTGRAPYQYVIDRRVACAMARLRDPAATIQAIAAQSGFAHASHLSRHLSRALGCSAAELRRSILL